MRDKDINSKQKNGKVRARQLSDASTEEATEALTDAQKAAKGQDNTEEREALTVRPYTQKFINDETYADLFEIVGKEISQMRIMLEGMEAKEKERQWLKNQQSGDLDDNRLVDGAAGERNVYKRRGTNQPLFGQVQKHPKRLRFCLDCSSSMSYFNEYDRRLDRMCAIAVMIMEAFSGLEHKYSYTISGHSGESHDVDLVREGMPPRNKGERLEVIQAMYEHASFCHSGDNTLASVRGNAPASCRRRHCRCFLLIVAPSSVLYSIPCACTRVPGWCGGAGDQGGRARQECSSR
eukprot:COSAG05_NODE_85_length_20698_cov_35.370309_17_plen_293_part_00